MNNKRLIRSHDTMALGVAAGIADYLDLDPTLIRLIFVLLTLAGGPGLIIYIIMAIVMPKAAIDDDIIIEKDPDAF